METLEDHMMKILPILVTISSLTLLSQVGRADITVGVSNPFSGNCYPFMCNDSGHSTGQSIEFQEVYSSAAFPSTPTTITSETFYLQPLFGGSDTLLGGTYEFSLSTTTAPVNGLSNTLANNLGPDNTSVLTYTVPAGGVSFGTKFTFSNTTPFTYNPANGNLLLDVTVFNQDNVPNFTGNSYNQVDSSGVTSRAYAFNGAPSGVADSIGLVTTFNASSVPEPSAFFPLAGVLGLGALLRRKLCA